MNVNPKKAIILLAIGALIVISIVLFDAPNGLVTREEAIEVSRNSGLVREGLAISRSFGVEINYYNSSRLERLREWHFNEIFENVPRDAFWEEKVPESHSAWEVIWWFHYQKKPGDYNVIVIVDAEMAKIIHEIKGIALG